MSELIKEGNVWYILNGEEKVKYGTELVKELYVCYGSSWDQFEECHSIGEVFVKELIDKGTISGYTYVEVMSTEFGIPMCELKDEKFSDMSFEILNLKEENFEKIVERFKYIKSSANKIYENFVYIIEDFPNYSNSKKDYYTTNIIFDCKNFKYGIIIGVKDKYNMKYKDEQEAVKKMIKSINKRN